MRERSCFLQKVQKSPECFRKRCSAVRAWKQQNVCAGIRMERRCVRKAEGEVRV